MEQLDYYSKLYVKEDNRFQFNPSSYISNSSLTAINPEQGGSPQKFLEFFSDTKEQKESKSLKSGKTLHRYIESPDDFILADFDMPGGMKPAFVEALFKEGFQGNHTLNNDDYEYARLNASEIAGYSVKRNKADTGWTGVQKLDEKDMAYLKFLHEASNKIPLTKTEKDQFVGMRDSLKSHPRISEFLFDSTITIGQTVYKLGEDFRRYNELAVYWSEAVGSTTIYRKALIDTMIFFPKLNTMYIIDTKTTGKSVYNFIPTEQRRSTLESWNIDRQLGYYNNAITHLFCNNSAYAVTKEGDKKVLNGASLPKLQSYIVAVESFGYFNSALIPIAQPTILYGERKMKELINRVVWHIEKQQWDMSKEEYLNGGLFSAIDYSKIERLK